MNELKCSALFSPVLCRMKCNRAETGKWKCCWVALILYGACRADLCGPSVQRLNLYILPCSSNILWVFICLCAGIFHRWLFNVKNVLHGVKISLVSRRHPAYHPCHWTISEIFFLHSINGGNGITVCAFVWSMLCCWVPSYQFPATRGGLCLIDAAWRLEDENDLTQTGCITTENARNRQKMWHISCL